MQEAMIRKYSLLASRIVVGAIAVLVIFSKLTLHAVAYDLWTLFFAMQLIVYLTIYKIAIPANAEIVLFDL
jgi:hypothetical protein